ERAAINAPIQGTAADIIKRAMIRISKTMIEKEVKSKMILQIHDELVFEVPDDEIEEMKNIVVSNMESAALPLVNFKVPLKVDTKISNSWDCA
ncbi:MAG: DNA polymerase I, partial [Rhizobiales bacterium]|nr:DNA polymerase I [Hyphomicrobiales bacterium]